MTTIVYKDGILAADTRMGGHMKYPIGLCKVARVERENGTISLIAGCGDMAYLRELEDWVMSDPRNGDQPSHDKAGGSAVMEVVLDPNEDRVTLYVYLSDTPDYWTVELQLGEYFAMGSGEAYAYGCLADPTKTAIDAVLAAAKFDNGTNDKVYYVNFLEAETWEYVP